MHLGEQVVDLRRVKAGRAEIVAGGLEVGQQVSQRHRLPFADRLVERDIERLLILRIFDVNDHAVDLRRALSDQHLIALMAPHDVARHLVPDDGIDISEVGEAALDLFIGRVAGLQVFARIVLRGLEPIHGDPLQIHLRIHDVPPNDIPLEKKT